VMVIGLGADDRSGMLPPYVFATFATCSYDVFLPNRPACVNVAFSHARASRWSALIVIMPLGLSIFIVAQVVWMIVMNFRRKGLPKMQLYPISKLATSNVISLHLLSPIPQDTSRSMRPIGVDDCPRMTL
jgi:hypothetical protein